MYVGQISNDEGSFRLRLHGKKLHSGVELEVAIPDPDLKWVPTILVMDEDLKFSLKGLEKYNPVGMFARTNDPYFD